MKSSFLSKVHALKADFWTIAATPSGFLVETADLNDSLDTAEMISKSKWLIKWLLFKSHSSVAIIFEGLISNFKNSSIKWVPSIQKYPFSFADKLSLKDLNLFIKGLFLLVMTKFFLSMICLLENWIHNKFFLLKKQ